MIGPMFTREAAVAPRRASFFAARTLFAGALFALTLTAWQLLVGSQQIENVGDLAWFGAAAFQILGPAATGRGHALFGLAGCLGRCAGKGSQDVRLAAADQPFQLRAGAGQAAGRNVVGHRGRRRHVAAADDHRPAWAAFRPSQILRIEAVTLASALVAGSLGSTIALWREKTFQALAMTALVLVLWLVGWEIVAAAAPERCGLGFPAKSWAMAMSPWQAVQEAARPIFPRLPCKRHFGRPGSAVSWQRPSAISALLNVVAIARVRAWNPRQEVVPRAKTKCRATRLPRTMRRCHRSVGRRNPRRRRQGPSRVGQPSSVARGPNLGLRQANSGDSPGLLGRVLHLCRCARHAGLGTAQPERHGHSRRRPSRSSRCWSSA